MDRLDTGLRGVVAYKIHLVSLMELDGGLELDLYHYFPLQPRQKGILEQDAFARSDLAGSMLID